MSGLQKIIMGLCLNCNETLLQKVTEGYCGAAVCERDTPIITFPLTVFLMSCGVKPAIREVDSSTLNIQLEVVLS